MYEMKETATGKNGACASIRGHVLSIAENIEAGVLSPDIRKHLDACPECALLVQRFAQAWKSWARPEEAPAAPSLFPALLKRIEAHEASLRSRGSLLPFALRILRPVALSAVFLGGILAGHEMGKAEKRLPPPEGISAGQILESFENIPPGSVADFLVSRQDLKKEGLR